MARVNVAEAKARLSELINAALRGEDVVIARRNVPVVKLTVVESGRTAPKHGLFRGEIWMAPDFDETPAEFAAYLPELKSKTRGKAGSRKGRKK